MDLDRFDLPSLFHATDGATILLAALSAIGAVLVGLVVLRSGPTRNKKACSAILKEPPPTFLFDDKTLVDASPAAQRILRSSVNGDDDWARLLDYLGRHFPGLTSSNDSAPEPGHYVAEEDDLRLEIESWGCMMRLTIQPSSAAQPTLHHATIKAMEEENKTLHAISKNAPLLIWQEDSQRNITWANAAFLALADKFAGRSDEAPAVWPPYRLFERLPLITEADDIAVGRLSIRSPGSSTDQWFEVRTIRHGSGTLSFATDMGEVITAEDRSRQFIQTITKTFAQLSIGLAIFDRKRRLIVFNPALMDLTGLPISFLSGQPPIRSFLDRLRDANKIPEPTNYRTWREEMAALEVAAERGTYRQTWSLPSGQTYRVTGRPHPDGAIALTFEDVTSEISLTRNFRSEIEIIQSVLDTLDEAIAVFSPAGTLWISNSAYRARWGHSADALEEIGIKNAIDFWQEGSAPAPFWAEARKFANRLGDRSFVAGEIRSRDGRALNCRLMPLPGGASMVGFSSVTEKHARSPAITAAMSPAAEKIA